MDILFRALGEHLVEAAQETQREAVLIAPFIKDGPFQKILSVISPSCEVKVVTRWHLSEIAAGASDPEIWETIESRLQCALGLVSNLHAKYYRFDNQCFAGSANLTRAALGWRESPNLELLNTFEKKRAEAFEEVATAAFTVTEDLYRQVQEMRKKYEKARPETVQQTEVFGNPAETNSSNAIAEPVERGVETREEKGEWWVPKLRHPEDLYLVYSGDAETVTSATYRHGQHDLKFFELSSGLGREEFELEVGWQLLQKPLVQSVDDFVATSRRFGAVRDYINGLPLEERADLDATHTWQALMRWLLYFLDNRYHRHEANYSEIFQRRK
jgi:hypothetical protein